MPTLEDQEPLLLSSPSCIILRSSNPIMIPAFRRRFPSTTTVFIWALLLLAFTASYIILVDPGSSVEKNVRLSAHVTRANGLSVLVTGAAGFIGSHVAIALKNRGDGVVGVDNFDNYYGRSLKETRRDLLELNGVYIVEGDINDSRLLSMLFDTVEFTHVMHLAAQVGVQYAVENPYAYVRSNVASLVTLLEQCKSAHPQPAVVWASSGSVYGVHNKVPYSETDRVDPPDTIYASTKRTGEEITHTYNRLHGLSITGLRFFTVYGPWGRPDMAYFSFVRNILQGEPITIYRAKNRVDPAREFIYIDDIVKGCVASLDTSGKSTGSGGLKNGSAPYRIFNLGNGSPVTVPALVAILEENLKMRVEKDVVDMCGDGDDSFAYVNISLAERELGYKPTTDLQTGLREFVKWYLWYYGKPLVEDSNV
ncbi:putative UDP-glucuronate 4-epimerase [Helianthus annuus]|uniref:UDP-glucuronate 4-epimerase n=2 Tax=Helianthus annuus TaxID=4232 RepID=A0A9K3N5I6_HELAN|nr:putative UDP-glucuronate 4-epimerase [Helianthus annuus]KAJ0514746.1 putative UDP-glucuronate 4-epimerase [Helianthus annuus]KAJ0530900.1 putative UDP-glucuronate 4-epimerase [Helianthus annuus]KAJ0701125.1 putative UDP-glucuronate 4-epimerase [Helianthus annuus]KAJ0880747.1 putative UDP-glucuronate 4-epimerase [Helianthus annuus]